MICSVCTLLYPSCAERENILTFGKPNWFGNAKAEHAAACNNVALFDLSSFAKFKIEVGLNKKCKNSVSNHNCCYDVCT